MILGEKCRTCIFKEANIIENGKIKVNGGSLGKCIVYDTKPTRVLFNGAYCENYIPRPKELMEKEWAQTGD